MRRTYYRTIKNNRIKLRGKVLGNENLQKRELDGKRFCFITCPDIGNKSGFSFDGLTALWGTEKLKKAESQDMFNQLYKENCAILAPDGFFRWYFWKEVK